MQIPVLLVHHGLSLHPNKPVVHEPNNDELLHRAGPKPIRGISVQSDIRAGLHLFLHDQHVLHNRSADNDSVAASGVVAVGGYRRLYWV